MRLLARSFLPSGFLFSTLQFRSILNYFIFFASTAAREASAGCYIDFSGFSTSRVLLAQECFTNTTCVTAGTRAGPKQKTSRDSIHGADI
jgi:hypothetical protein